MDTKALNINVKLKRKKVDGLWVYDIPNDVCKKLLKAGEEAKKVTYPRHGKYAVACLTSKGNIYQGISYHSDSYTLTMHSEMTALAHAAIHGEAEVIAMTGPNCHLCKQIMWESCINSGIDMTVIIEENNQIKKILLSTMMIYPWPDRYGNK